MNDSPIKKLDFAAGKENMPVEAAHDPTIPKPIKGIPLAPVVVEKPVEKAAVANTNLRPEEQDEPLLQENPNRFVLFPIKYHEVSRVIHALRVECK
jgi:ribonucleoside-diphosphate reductase subunit M2